MVRTRIAPSPTGEDIHIGNLYTALVNYAVAHKHDGKFVIRIEDTDQQRLVQGAEEKILSTIHEFGLQNDEGPDVGGPFAPYRQSQRLSLYKKYAEELIAKGKAYYCFCSKQRLDELRKKALEEKRNFRYDKHCLKVKSEKLKVKSGEPYVIRLNVETGKKIWFEDLIRGRIEFDSGEIDDQILIKSDGYPTYHMAVVVDDHLMEISHVIRAEEWISSTPKHIILYESFGWKLPIFAHLPILRNPDKSKLSKRKNPVWASWYLREGFLPEAVLNYLALMGWSHPEEKELFSLAEFIETFDLKDVKPVGPVFDLQKLAWLNGEWIRKIYEQDKNTLKNTLLEFYKDDASLLSLINGTDGDVLIDLSQSRMKTLKDFKTLVEKPQEKIVYSDAEVGVAKELADMIEKISPWTAEHILEELKTFQKSHDISMKSVYRLIMQRDQGLPMVEWLVLKKSEILQNLRDV